MKILNTYEYRLPEFLLPALVNGDITGLSEDGEEALRKAESAFSDLVKEDKGSHYTIDYEGESYFSWNPDFIPAGCNVVDVKVHIFG